MELPRWGYRLSRRLRALFHGGALDRELDEELQFHLDQLVEASLARGLPPDEARRAALLAIGGIEQRKEACRDTRRVRLVGDLLQDLQYAVRTLRRARAFSAAAILTLALGIGTTVAMFTVVHGVLLRPLPFPDPDRLYLVSLTPRHFVFMRHPGMADRTYVAFREHDTPFQHLAAFTTYKGNLIGAGDPTVIAVGSVTTEFFDVLGTPPALGRTFVPEDGLKGGEHTLVMSDELWRTRFGADPALVGTRVTLNGTRHTVIGIMPADFDFPGRTSAWTPHTMELSPGNSLLVSVVGRLKPGIPDAQARTMFETVVAALPEGPPEDRSQWAIGILPLVELLVGDIRRPLQIFAGAVLLVLLIACGNVANLLLARASGREREIAVRAALGAGRVRLVRQLLTESMLLASCGAALGVLFAHWGVAALLAVAPAGRIPRAEMIRIDEWVIVFAALTAAMSAILFGLAPALGLTRRRFAGSLLPGGRSVVRSQDRFRAALAVGQIAVALVLLSGAGVMTKSFLRLRAIEPGFDTTNVVRLSLELSEPAYPKVEQLQIFHQQMLERLSGVPDVVAVGLVNWMPLGDMHLWGDFRIDGIPGNPGFNVDKTVVSAGYFRAMGMPVRRGRDFSERDDGSNPPVAIVSRTVARAMDPAEDVIGRRVSLASNPVPEDWLTVIGIVDDVRQLGPTQQARAAIYRPYQQVRQRFFLGHMTYVVRTASEPLAAVPPIRGVLRVVDRDQPATAVGLLDEAWAATTAEPGFYARLLGLFALLSILLALVGTYGVVAYAVAQRSREIGLRMALGARRSAVLWLVIRRTVLVAAAGVAIGIAAAWLATRLLETFLFETAPTDPATFTVVALTVFIAALLAGAIPARRATRVDPVVALRHD